MKFEINRTSLDPYIHGNVPPCEEAINKSNYEWFIEVNSLEELVYFCDKYGDIIIGKPFGVNGMYTVEIYDDYRE